MKVVKEGSGRRPNGKEMVLQEPVWGECRFSKEANEVPNYPQQNHVNKKNSRVGRASVSRGSRSGFQLTEKLPQEKQSPIERTWRHPRKPKETLPDQSQGIIPTRERKSGSAGPLQTRKSGTLTQLLE